jgi:hypothetical protein
MVCEIATAASWSPARFSEIVGSPFFVCAAGQPRGFDFTLNNFCLASSTNFVDIAFFFVYPNSP